MTPAPLLSLRGITRTFTVPDSPPLEILTGVDLDIHPGEHVAIVGRSGTGKSTLLNTLGLIDIPTSGSYHLAGHDTAGLSERRRAHLRGQTFGFVFQSFNLIDGLTTTENVAAPLLYDHGTAFWSRASRAEGLLNAVGLGAKAGSPIGRLSGGEQQRVAIARALARRPRVILADEPTGALDVDTGASVMSLLEQQCHETGAALILITHDLAVAGRADTQYRLEHGVLTPISVTRQRVGSLEEFGEIQLGAPAGAHAAPAPTRPVQPTGGLSMKLFAGAGGALTGFVGAIIEAWAQLRIGKLRVLLSLVGVAAAVAAMSYVIAVGQVSVSAINTQLEQYGGRPGTVTISVSPTGKNVTAPDRQGDDSPDDAEPDAAASAASGTGRDSAGASSGSAGGSADGLPGAGSSEPTSAATSERINRAMASFVDRYQASTWDTTYSTKVRFALPDGPREVKTQAVTAGYGTLHRTTVSQGRWFRQDDADDLSPALVVSQGFLEALGVSELREPITVTSYTPTRSTFTVVGVLKPEDLSYCTTTDADGNTVPCKQPISAFILTDSYERLLPEQAERPAPTLEIWAGPEETQEVKDLAKKDFDGRFGQGSTQAVDNLSFTNSAVDTKSFTTVVTGAGVFVMILGALGLVNISLVTVRQRIHEIGVRRSFGATSRRIFFSIMLESVVATVVAGAVGVGLAIVALRALPLSGLLGIPVEADPPFPMMAAVIGLLAATVVGALSGIVPAIVAVRIRPIDAIRY